MKTCYYPFNMDQNLYVKIIKECIKENNEVYDFNDVIRDRKILKDIEIVNLNWFENIKSKTVLGEVLRFIYKYLIITYLKKRGKKIVWTMHNKQPHDTRLHWLSDKLLKKIIVNSDKIVVLSYESEEILKKYLSDKEINKKTYYIPHPNYINQYPKKEIDFKSKLNIKENDIVILFMGAVRPYKNIELIVKIAEKYKTKNIKFIIAGAAIDNKYKNEIINMVGENSDNIKGIFRFIEDNEIESLVNICDIMIFPYDKKSSLNSGSVILSFSYGKTVICPLIGTLKDIKNKDMFFSYDYKDEDDHYKKLDSIIEKIYEDVDSKNKLKEMGEKCYNYVNKNNNIKLIENMYKKLYNDMLKEI